MPATSPLPTISDMLGAFRAGAHGEDATTDVRRGSSYDEHGGVAAVLLSREAQRDRDVFRAIYFDTADGDELTDRGLSLYAIPRIGLSYGSGTVSLTRPTAGAGAGTIWQGTRVWVVNAPSPPREYVVLADTAVGGSATTATVAIRALDPGAGSTLTATQANAAIFVADTLWDYWSVTSVACDGGTDIEPPADYRARVRSTRLAARPGYEATVTAAALAAGASMIALFRQDVDASTDMGSVGIYIDGGSTVKTALFLALDSAGVAGVDAYIGDLSTQAVNVTATVALSDDPGNYNLGSLETTLKRTIVTFFERLENPYLWTAKALGGALANAHEAVQDVTFSGLTADPAIIVKGAGTWAWATAVHLYSAGTIALSFVKA